MQQGSTARLACQGYFCMPWILLQTSMFVNSKLSSTWNLYKHEMRSNVSVRCGHSRVGRVNVVICVSVFFVSPKTQVMSSCTGNQWKTWECTDSSIWSTARCAKAVGTTTDPNKAIVGASLVSQQTTRGSTRRGYRVKIQKQSLSLGKRY